MASGEGARWIKKSAGEGDESSTLTVGQITARVKDLIEGSDDLQAVRVLGEASNVKLHPSGHLYFSLKDEEAQISAVMFKGDRRGVSFPLEDGMKVIVTGDVRVYAPQGRYQLYVVSLEKAGLGDLFKRFEELKKKLAAEGLFDPKHKKPFPKYPIKIGIVTSPTGAAIEDIKNILSRRWPLVEITLAPALVQGEKAPSQIVAGIRALDRLGLDVMIVGRGGGSMEDLWCFNDEAVARSVFEARTPVVSAVGHEIDFTIIDFVADLRAPTPSAAAEIVSPDIDEVRERLADYADRMTDALDGRVDSIKDFIDDARSILQRPLHGLELTSERLKSIQLQLAEILNQRYSVLKDWHSRLGRRLEERSPWARVESLRSQMKGELHRMEVALRDQLGRIRLHLDRDGRRLGPLTIRRWDQTMNRLNLAGEKMRALNPTSILARGYAVVFDEKGRAVKTAENVVVGAGVSVRLHEGELSCRVEKKRTARN